ncbi:uncharacterized protein LOC129299153 [Prosopis cineraria]|uniref:uncharacterized protein LOC129299153 n=1 Tax=Prosopis cineraria TaxID=364024 RepID=UPI0024105B39|nr:uncharacterized protein LOC129299153 [Prosopis cineraria]XP_054793590.1 uncharacterized protein LOC129299153 [Prosopis cineraria]XP_054793597.1 uncharacterized protein LOC129299153 [Prosopis cineraria]
MATARPKENSAVGKEKIISSNSQSTSTKKTTKPCATSDKPAPSSEKEKQIPNYLRPTISSRHESLSLKNSKIDSPQRTVINRRRSLDKPPSPSHLTKHSQSSSRLHKALVSPGPRERSGAQLRPLSFSSRGTIPSKSGSDKTSRTAKDGKLSASTRSVSRSSKSPSPTPKKVARDGSAAANSTKAPKNDAETKEELKTVEAEVKEATIEKIEEVVMKDDNEQEESENATDQINPPVVDTGNAHEHKKEHKQHRVVEESKPGEPQIQADNNNVIPTASEDEEQQQQQEAAVSVAEETKAAVEAEETEKEDPPEEKAEDVHQEDEGKKGPDESIDHPEPEEQKVDVEEKEEENDNGVAEEKESQNNEEEKAKDEKEVAEGETEEGVQLKEGEDDDDVETEVKEEKAELTPPKQQGAGGQGKETTQVSNDVIEETASKLEKRTNKVRALAGAFQTVIDHQSK